MLASRSNSSLAGLIMSPYCELLAALSLDLMPILLGWDLPVGWPLDASLSSGWIAWTTLIPFLVVQEDFDGKLVLQSMGNVHLESQCWPAQRSLQR